MSSKPAITRTWWKEASIYQIYPSSFKDSNGDGLGDIRGITSKVDYIKQLGVDMVWLSPINKSPQVDMGYDISDYKDIHPPFGDLKDVDELIGKLHDNGIKFIMDLVVNHTSNEHEWFKQSKKSKDNPYRDYYIWRAPKYDENGQRHPPNNWGAVWGGSAWEYDEPSDEYYLHIFAPEQPDLNWDHPPVRTAVDDIMRFWLKKGVDGFRMDVINFISKVPGLPDATPKGPDDKFPFGGEHFACGPRLHEYLHDIGTTLKEFDAFSVGEMPCVKDPNQIIKAVRSDRQELNMIFHFHIVKLDEGSGGRFTPRKWEMSKLKSIVSNWQHFMLDNDGWNALYLENHDQGRSVSRFGSDLPEFREVCAKMLATFLGLQSGTVFLYQGQELGMINIPKDRGISEYKDIETTNRWKLVLEEHPDDKDYQKMTLEEIQKKSRDHARTPMQWDDAKYAGFSTAEPWQKVNESYLDCNAAAQVGVEGSVFFYWASVLALRKSHKDVFVYGDYALVDGENEDVFAYARTYEGETVLVVCNFRAKDATLMLNPEAVIHEDKLLLSTHGALSVEGHVVKMRAFEAFACPASHLHLASNDSPGGMTL